MVSCGHPSLPLHQWVIHLNPASIPTWCLSYMVPVRHDAWFHTATIPTWWPYMVAGPASLPGGWAWCMVSHGIHPYMVPIQHDAWFHVVIHLNPATIPTWWPGMMTVRCYLIHAPLSMQKGHLWKRKLLHLYSISSIMII